MATYEFTCCGITQEIVASIREQLPKPTCTICNGDMQRIYSKVGAVFKGQGFYSTDNRR